MVEHLRALVERSDDQTAGPIRFIASTEGIKRDGVELTVDSWDLDNYRKNPVVLWVHDYWGTHPPIGRADTLIDVDGKRLLADVTFDQEDVFARQIESKYRRGFLNTVSVGWDPHKDGRNELLDISAVPVPGDPDALMERQIRGLQHVGQRLIDLLDDEPDDPKGDEAEAVWAGTALRMVRLFVSAADDGFNERAYRRLCRQYQRLGKTAPEVPANIDAMSGATIRGLFLAGEADLVPELFFVDKEPAPDPAIEQLTRIRDLFAGVTT